MDKIKSEVYRLYKEDGWVADVVITDEHMIAGYTDYGNFVYKWSKTQEDFKEFLLRIDPGYLGYKITSSNTYTYGRHTKKEEGSIQRMIGIVLPLLQAELKKERTII